MLEPMISAAEVARRLGVARSTVCRLARGGKLPNVRVGARSMRFEWEEVKKAIGLGEGRRGCREGTPRE